MLPVHGEIPSEKREKSVREERMNPCVHLIQKHGERHLRAVERALISALDGGDVAFDGGAPALDALRATRRIRGRCGLDGLCVATEKLEYHRGQDRRTPKPRHCSTMGPDNPAIVKAPSGRCRVSR